MTRTLINATLLITVLSSLIAFFSGLDVLATLLSISTLFISTMMAVALLVRRYYLRGIRQNLVKLMSFFSIIKASSIGISAYWGLDHGRGWFGYLITVPLWFLGTSGLSVFLPQQRTPKVWRVPLVPWLPSLSIVTNIFLMGSLGFEAFIRFGICTVAMLVYYVFVGLHATYERAYQRVAEREGLEIPAEYPTNISASI